MLVAGKREHKEYLVEHHEEEKSQKVNYIYPKGWMLHVSLIDWISELLQRSFYQSPHA